MTADADLVKFRLRPRTSGAWGALLLAGASPVDRHFLLEFLAAFSADLEQGSVRPVGALVAARLVLALDGADPTLAVLAECVLCGLCRQALAAGPN